MMMLMIIIVLIMFWFGGNAVAQEDLIAKRTLKADKLFNKAKEMYEGNFLSHKKASFKDKKFWATCCKKFSNT
jgi:hypothetical protein